jgi:hypothetical protein
LSALSTSELGTKTRSQDDAVCEHLDAIYSFGVFEELVETNVCRAVPKDKLLKRGKPKQKVYTDVDAPLLINHVRDNQLS